MSHGAMFHAAPTYEQALIAAGGVGAELHEARYHLMRALENPYDLNISEEVKRQFTLMSNLLQEFVELSFTVEIRLMIMGKHGHSDIVRRDKRKIRNQIREELSCLRTAAADLGVEGLRVSFTETEASQDIFSPHGSPVDTLSWNNVDLGARGGEGGMDLTPPNRNLSEAPPLLPAGPSSLPLPIYTNHRHTNSVPHSLPAGFSTYDVHAGGRVQCPPPPPSPPVASVQERHNEASPCLLPEGNVPGDGLSVVRPPTAADLQVRYESPIPSSPQLRITGGVGEPAEQDITPTAAQRISAKLRWAKEKVGELVRTPRRSTEQVSRGEAAVASPTLSQNQPTAAGPAPNLHGCAPESGGLVRKVLPHNRAELDGSYTQFSRTGPLVDLSFDDEATRRSVRPLRVPSGSLEDDPRDSLHPDPRPPGGNPRFSAQGASSAAVSGRGSLPLREITHERGVGAIRTSAAEGTGKILRPDLGNVLPGSHPSRSSDGALNPQGRAPRQLSFSTPLVAAHSSHPEPSSRNPDTLRFLPSHPPLAADLGDGYVTQRSPWDTLPGSDATQYLAKVELMKVPKYQFDGDPDNFTYWAHWVEKQMALAGLDSIDRIRVLRLHTAGDARDVVETHGTHLPPEVADGAYQEIMQTLRERFGNPAILSGRLCHKVQAFPAIHDAKDVIAMGKFRDLCKRILNTLQYSSDVMDTDLEVFTRKKGLMTLSHKLPKSLRERWEKEGDAFMRRNPGSKPRLHEFAVFVQDHYSRISNPYFRDFTNEVDDKSKPTAKPRPDRKSASHVFRIGGDDDEHSAGRTPTTAKEGTGCVLHNDASHDLLSCSIFETISPRMRLSALIENHLCFRCAEKHRIGDCEYAGKCEKCGRSHATILHDLPPFKPKPPRRDKRGKSDAPVRGVEREGSAEAPASKDTPRSARVARSSDDDDDDDAVDDLFPFTRTYLANVRHKGSGKVLRCLVMTDDQSWESYMHPDLTEKLDIGGPMSDYRLRTLGGLSSHVGGMEIKGLEVQAISGGPWHQVPKVKGNRYLPNTRFERGTSAIVAGIDHLAHLSDKFEGDDDGVATMLLLGLDAGWAHKSSMVGEHAPFALESPLGWALVGRVPRDQLPRDFVARAEGGTVGRTFRTGSELDSRCLCEPTFLPCHDEWKLESSVFETRPDDEQPSLSVENQQFLQTLKDGLRITEQGFIELPMPVRSSITSLPNNEAPVFHRTVNTLTRAKADPAKLKLLCDAMQLCINRGHVEMVPESEKVVATGRLCWFLPVFPVFNKAKVRLVFDAKACFRGVSLNSALHQGPDLNNTLRGVMLRFRCSVVAFMLDIAYMFNCFVVPELQRDLLRFFWWEGNDASKGLVQYRSTVHLFGACCSPSVAVFGLKVIAETARHAGDLSDEEADFLAKSFYMDDGMGSCDLPEEAIRVIDRVIVLLAKYGLNIHKINSNSPPVRDAFASHDGLSECVVPLSPDGFSKALGVSWDTKADQLHVLLALPDRPFTRRGLLATTNSLYDPQGMACPITLGARLLQREILSNQPPQSPREWDAPLPTEYADRWGAWKKGVSALASISIPRCIFPFSSESRKELHCFCDASQDAIACALYARSIALDGAVCVRFVCGASKVAPRAANTTPRLELCAAALGIVQVQQTIEDLPVDHDSVRYYSDSRVVLGYIANESRSFSRYVSRRVEAIRKHSRVEAWHFVPTDLNPADLGTRPLTPSDLQDSIWLSGPEFLRRPDEVKYAFEPCTSLPEMTRESPLVCTTTPDKTTAGLVALASRTSRWARLVRTVQLVVKCWRVWSDRVRQRRAISLAASSLDMEVPVKDAELALFRASQIESFPELFNAKGEPNSRALAALPEGHGLGGLTPMIGPHDELRVGGRLRHRVSPFEVKHPILLDGKHVVTRRYVEHVHSITPHQGRVITLAMVRSQGVFILGGRKLIEDVIKHCTMCAILRKKPCTPLMADLPLERVHESAPFDHIGVDVFGPFKVSNGVQTKRKPGELKLFVLLINCLATRAIHLEALDGMDTTSMMNALRRFFAIRGRSKTVRSDRGTNFVGTVNQSPEFESLMREEEFHGIKWDFHPVGASHYGGFYERRIGAVRRVLEATLARQRCRLNRDDFITVLYEAAAVVNSTPLYGLSGDAGDALPLSPAMLLTLKEPGGRLMEATSERDLMATGKRRWRRAQHLADSFWSMWRDNYLHELTTRRKWKVDKAPLKKDDVVLIREKNTPRCDWRMGRVSRPISGADGRVRRAVVTLVSAKGQQKETERAVTDLVIVVAAEEEQDPNSQAPGNVSSSVTQGGAPQDDKI